jgi:hypothetical protein
MKGGTHLIDVLVSAPDIGVIEEYKDADGYEYPP